MKVFFFALVGALIASLGLYIVSNMKNFNSAPANSASYAAKLETDRGVIEIALLPSAAPKTVANFATLARQGFYDGLTFHRVIPSFMIQGGDPLCGKNGAGDAGPCGTGGPGYKFADEINSASELYKAGYEKGIVAMANSGPNTNGSQFFIMVSDVPLPPNYTIFGRVKSGQEVADEISQVTRNSADRPTTPIIIRKVAVE